MCKVTYNTNSGNYKEVNDFKCDTGLTCAEVEDDGGSAELTGTCQSEKCGGKSPGNPNLGEGTHKVTICHRTCSEKNIGCVSPLTKMAGVARVAAINQSMTLRSTAKRMTTLLGVLTARTT